MIANIRELRASTKAILRAVDRGDTVIITNRGKPYAKLVPVKSVKSSKKKVNPLFGIWKDFARIKSKFPRQYVRQLREGRHAH